MSSESSSSGEVEELRMVFEVHSVESTPDPPKEEWSSFILEAERLKPKQMAYHQGLYSPGSGEICVKYITMSDSSMLAHPYYKYPSVLDPGITAALLDEEPKVVYPDDGQEHYLALCKQMDECVVKKFYKSLLEEKINLKYYCVNPPGIRAMAAALQFNRFVKILDLTENFLSNDACFHLGEMLGRNTTLQELILEGCRIGPAGVKCLMAGLMVNRDLRVLNLNRNQLGETGGEFIAQAFDSGIDLKEIYLSGNNLGTKTATALAAAFEFQNKLTHIDLSWNNLYSPIGMFKLINTFEESKEIQWLNLSWNGLAGPRIGAALKNAILAPQLTHLDLSNNKLGGDAITAILLNLGKAKKLVTLNLAYNPLDEKDSLAIIVKVKSPAVKLGYLYLDNVPVNTEFMVRLDQFKRLKSKKHLVVTHGHVKDTIAVKGPDPRETILNRAEFLAKKPKKHKFDIALIFMQLFKDGNTIMNAADFETAVLATGAPLDSGCIDEIVNIFPGPKTKKTKTVNLRLLVEYIKRKWPDRKLPLTPPPLSEPEQEPEPEPIPDKSKGKAKGKGKK